MTYRLIKPAAFLLGITLSSVIFADTLRDAIECAMRLNPDVRFAATHRWTTEEQLKQQKAGYLPTLDLAAGEGFQDSDNVTASALYSGNQARLTRTESSLTLDQNLFNGFATTSEVHRLKATVRSAAYKAGGTSEDVGLKVTEQYLEILRREKLAALARDNLAVLQGTTGMIGERTRAGISRTADLNQADGRLALARATIIAEDGNLEDAKTSYRQVVGIAPKGLSKPRAPQDAALPSTEEEAIAIAIENHPTLKSANADIAAARAQHETSKSTNYPQIDIVLSASRNRNLDGQPGVNNDEKAMLRGTWNLFKGGQDMARQRETAYETQEAIETRNRTLWQVQETTRLSWNAWHVSAQRMKSLEGHRDFSGKTVQAYKDQFKLGQRTLLDWLNAQDELYQANVDYVTAQYTELYARFRLLNSMGKLMDYIGVSRPVEASVKMPQRRFNT